MRGLQNRHRNKESNVGTVFSNDNNSFPNSTHTPKTPCMYPCVKIIKTGTRAIISPGGIHQTFSMHNWLQRVTPYVHLGKATTTTTSLVSSPARHLIIVSRCLQCTLAVYEARNASLCELIRGLICRMLLCVQPFRNNLSSLMLVLQLCIQWMLVCGVACACVCVCMCVCACAFEISV